MQAQVGAFTSMEDTVSPQLVLDGYVSSVKFSMSEAVENSTYSINNSSITHSSQLTNPFLGLPVESGMCESCGTAEQEKCEGHFGYIELPIPVYHPCHVSEVRNILSWVCLKCLKMKKLKIKSTKGKKTVSNASCPSCRDSSISIEVVERIDGILCLELKVPSKSQIRDGFWNFLDKFGFHADNGSSSRPLLASEDEGVRKAGGDLSQIATAARVAAIATAAINTNTLTTATTFAPSPLLAISGPSSDTLLNVSGLTSSATVALDRAIAAAHNLHANLAKLQAESMPEHYEAAPLRGKYTCECS